MAEECLLSFCISNEDELRRPIGREEISGRLVRLSLSRHKVHVPRWDADEG